MKAVAVAFLQNMWVKDPVRVRASIARYGEEYRMRLIKRALFAGCFTGRRLRSAFTEDYLGMILWEESTREIAGDPKTIFRADPDHIRAVLKQYEPSCVLTFGKIATDAVTPLWTGRIVACPHPAARQPDTVTKLYKAAQEFRNIVSTIPVPAL